MSEWQPIETAPEMRNIILYAPTPSDDMPDNYRMGSGFWSNGHNNWMWEGRELEPWGHKPTLWQPLPDPPKLS